MEISKFESVSGKKEDDIPDSCCVTVFKIILQIFLWALIAGLIAVLVIVDRRDRNYFSYILIISISLFFVYLFYICTAFISPEWRYISNIMNESYINQQMQKIFSNPLKIIFNLSCYHYYYTHGKNRRRKKVTTYKAQEEFKYFSGRDISGVFNLDSNKINTNSNKSMMKLKIKIDFEFADEISQLDYNMKKDYLIANNRSKDLYMDFIEEKLIDDYEEFNLISLGSQPYFVNQGLYIIFTLLTLAEIYKCYFNSICATHEFTIRKVLSTRFDLNQNTFVKKYSVNDPKMIIGGNMHTFDKVHYQNERTYDLPTEDEVNRASGLNVMLQKRLSNYNINLSENQIGKDEFFNPYGMGAENQNNFSGPVTQDPAPPIFSINNTSSNQSFTSDTELSVNISGVDNPKKKDLQTKFI